MENNSDLHIIGNLYNCNFDGIACSRSAAEDLLYRVEQKIQFYNLTYLGKAYYFFGENAITAAFILAESHVTFHTWPEKNYASIDVFVCNFTQDNSEKARNIFRELSENILKSKKIKKQEIIR
jgi:S-adenosylmethionine decarboxylase